MTDYNPDNWVVIKINDPFARIAVHENQLFVVESGE